MNCSNCSSPLTCFHEWTCTNCGLVYGPDLLQEFDADDRTTTVHIKNSSKQNFSYEPNGDKLILSNIVQIRSLLLHSNPCDNLKLYSSLIHQYILKNGQYSPKAIAACILYKSHNIAIKHLAYITNISTCTLRKCLLML
jgi:hypothetical protein